MFSFLALPFLKKKVEKEFFTKSKFKAMSPLVVDKLFFLETLFAKRSEPLWRISNFPKL